jgi:hypothetical protein
VRSNKNDRVGRKVSSGGSSMVGRAGEIRQERQGKQGR